MQFRTAVTKLSTSLVNSFVVSSCFNARTAPASARPPNAIPPAPPAAPVNAPTKSLILLPSPVMMLFKPCAPFMATSPVASPPSAPPMGSSTPVSGSTDNAPATDLIPIAIKFNSAPASAGTCSSSRNPKKPSAMPVVKLDNALHRSDSAELSPSQSTVSRSS